MEEVFHAKDTEFERAKTFGVLEVREVNTVARPGYLMDGKFYFASRTSAFGVMQTGLFYVKENQ